MKFISGSSLSQKHKNEIVELWNKEYPEKLCFPSLAEFEVYLSELNDQAHILMLDRKNTVCGWYFDFLRDNERWFSLIIDSDFQGNGYGSIILDRAKVRVSELNGWIIDHNNYKKKSGEVYRSPLTFYLKNGFVKIENSCLASEKIAAVKMKWKRN